MLKDSSDFGQYWYDSIKKLLQICQPWYALRKYPHIIASPPKVQFWWACSLLVSFDMLHFSHTLSWLPWSWLQHVVIWVIVAFLQVLASTSYFWTWETGYFKFSQAILCKLKEMVVKQINPRSVSDKSVWLQQSHHIEIMLKSLFSILCLTFTRLSSLCLP